MKEQDPLVHCSRQQAAAAMTVTALITTRFMASARRHLSGKGALARNVTHQVRPVLGAKGGQCPVLAVSEFGLTRSEKPVCYLEGLGNGLSGRVAAWGLRSGRGRWQSCVLQAHLLSGLSELRCQLSWETACFSKESEPALSCSSGLASPELSPLSRT